MRRRPVHLAAPVALLLAFALGVGMYLAGPEHGLAAVIDPGDNESPAISNAAICAVQNVSGSFIDAEFVDASMCPDMGDAPLPYATKWTELDFSSSGDRIRSDFAPGPGELDGLMPGARINLRDTGINQSEIDLSEAIKANADDSTGRELFCAIAVNVGESSPPSECTDPTILGRAPTFLLDGGDDDTGLGNLPTSVDEGGILYIPFHFGDRPRGLNFPVKRGVLCDDPISNCRQDPSTAQSSPINLTANAASATTVERFVAFEINGYP